MDLEENFDFAEVGTSLHVFVGDLSGFFEDEADLSFSNEENEVGVALLSVNYFELVSFLELEEGHYEAYEGWVFVFEKSYAWNYSIIHL